MDNLVNEILALIYHNCIEVDIDKSQYIFKRVDPDRLFKVVCNLLNQDEDEVRSNYQGNTVTENRHIIYCFLKEYSKLGCQEIANMFEGRGMKSLKEKKKNKSHASVLQGIKKIEERITVDKKLKAKIDILNSRLKKYL